jgi:tRNA A-37 threonylcarbamoyl transferase component Bud32
MTTASESSSRDGPADAIIAAYLEAEAAGQVPNRADILAGHPDVVGELKAFFADHDAMKNLARQASTLAPVREEAGPAEAVTLATTQPSANMVGSRIRYVGDYELIEEIARGGMGVVYKAAQTSLNRIVALKMMLSAELASTEDVQRFQREARAVANLDHPNIVPIFEVNEHEGRQYFSMKFIAGESLGQMSRKAKWTDKEKNEQAAKLMATIARAVHHAHERGILHRDLKPGNILLDADGQPHVTDFGLAKQFDLPNSSGDMATRTGAIVGTPAYMAPEQASGQKGAVTTSADVYGLGAILYELLTGRPPFQGGTVMDTLLQVTQQEPRRPRSIAPGVAADLETICLKCLAKEPTKRYASALALAEDLERWTRGEPITARPVSIGERIVKWCRRNPSVAILIVVLICWLFNIRLRLAWFHTALIGQMSLVMVWPFVQLTRALIRGERPPPVRFSRDVIYLTALGSALAILVFSIGNEATRKSLILGILVSALWLQIIFDWLSRRKQAGALILAVRPRKADIGAIVLTCAFTMLVLIFIIGFAAAPESEGLTDTDFYFLPAIIGFIPVVVWIWTGVELRERGCVKFLRSATWNEIDFYKWARESGKLVDLRMYLVGGTPLPDGGSTTFFTAIRVPITRKAEIEDVLNAHISGADRSAG